MAYDVVVFQQTLDVVRCETGDSVEVEPVKRGPERLAFDQDRPPAQSGLKTLEAQFLKKPAVVADGESPFRVVILEELGRRPWRVAVS